MDPFPIVEILWFFAGVVSYRLGLALLRYGQMQLFVRETTLQILKLLGSASEDIAFAKALKYRALHESGISESEIEKIKEVDQATFVNWKKSTIFKMISLYPRKYLSELKFYDWDGAMKVLVDIYKEEKKTNERQ